MSVKFVISILKLLTGIKLCYDCIDWCQCIKTISNGINASISISTVCIRIVLTGVSTSHISSHMILRLELDGGGGG